MRASGTEQNKIYIGGRYLISNIMTIKQQYNTFECLDISTALPTLAYFKPLCAGQTAFNRKINENTKNKVSSTVLWTGKVKVDRINYNVEVHQKLGPSLKKVLQVINKPLSTRDFLHFFYELLRLIEKLASGNYVYRQIDPQTIVFDKDPLKSDLYFLNVFPIKKKNQSCVPITTKFNSKGAHLGLNANAKDDLESICHLLTYVHCYGLKENNQKKKMPQICIDFCDYVSTLNYSDEINYYHWKNAIIKIITKETITMAYGWVYASSNLAQDSFVQENSVSQTHDFNRNGDFLAGFSQAIKGNFSFKSQFSDESSDQSSFQQDQYYETSRPESVQRNVVCKESLFPDWD